MAKGKKKIGICTYCGEAAELTRDHVVPRTLFEPPYPPDLITVPACAKCNSVDKSRGDTILRDYLGLDLFGNQSKSGQAVYPKILRANERGQSELARKLAMQSEIKPLYTSAGIFLGDVPTAKLEEGTIEVPISTIVRGLFFHEFEERIPDDYQFDVRRIFEWDIPGVLRRINPLNASQPCFYGKTFGYLYLRAIEDRFTTIWLIWFFDRVGFVVSTVEPGIVLPKGRELFGA